MANTPFSALARLAAQLESTTARHELSALVAGFLQHLAPDEIAPAARLIIGQVFPEGDERTLKVGWRTLTTIVQDLAVVSPQVRASISDRAVDGGHSIRLMLEHGRREPPAPPPLSVLEVYQGLEAIAASVGPGSNERKANLLRGLLQRASPEEAMVLAKIIFRDMRHGVSEGIMLEAIGQAAGVKTRWVRRANQLWGDIGAVARSALTEGEHSLKSATITIFRPIKPMLAQTAETVDAALERFGERYALEYKLDGARVQIHRDGEQIRIYSRNLAQVTESLPDVTGEAASGLAARRAILDGEVIAVDSSGRPLPFQHLMRRFRRQRDIRQAIAEVPVQLVLFDALFVDGEALLDLPAERRWTRLEEAAGAIPLVRRLVMPALAEAEAFAEAAYQDGHEGVMAKDLDSAYGPGVRGKAWLKIKHVTSLDLVVVAADWGYGRRHGWLSNYHLAARNAATGDYEVVGKTFKGLTDAEFQEMTRRLLEIERARRGSTVYVEPTTVVEVLFNEVQQSSQYRSGLALRFARIARVREDKQAEDADTLQMVEQLLQKQFRHKARPS